MPRKNLAVDPSVRTGTTAAYLPVNGATLDLTDDYSWYGKGALIVKKSDSNGSGVQIATPVPVVAGSPYAIAWYGRLPVTVPLSEHAELMLQVTWVDSFGIVAGTNTSAILELDSDDQWFRIGGVWVAPVGATLASVSLIQPVAGSAGAEFVVDALLIEQANYIGGYFENLPDGEKMAVVKKALSAVPQMVNNVRLGADVVLNDLVLNTIDEEGTLWIVTDIDGWWGQAEPEIPDIARGTEDGSYDVEGRTKARALSVSGFFIPADAGTALSAAIDRLVEATNLTRRGGWLHAHENPTKAAWVRLSSRPSVRTVNARGKTEFTINLRAGDPIKYHWDDQDPDGYTNLKFNASDVIGYADNIGTADVTGMFTITGPAGKGTRIQNVTTGEVMTLQEPLRGAGLIADAYEVESTNGIATVRTVAPNHLRVGDEVSLLNMVIPFSESTRTRIVTAVSEVYPYSFSFAIDTDDVDPMSTMGQIRLVNNDVLEIDTYNRAVTYNGERSGHRNRLVTLTDWIKFSPGENLIEFYDDITETEVVSKRLTNNVVTLTTKETHYLIPGEQFSVDLPEDVPLSKKSLTNNVVTLTTTDPHGFSVGDVVDVESTEKSTVVGKSRTSDLVTLTTQDPHGVAVGDQATIALPTTAASSGKSLTDNVATITTQQPHGFSPGDSVTVVLATGASIVNKELTNNQATLTTQAAHNFSVGDTIQVALPSEAVIVGKSRVGSQIIMTTQSAHGFSSGDVVIMDLPTTAQFSGNMTADGTTNLVTVNTTAPHGFSVGDRITFSGLALGRWNTTWVIETVTSTGFTFRDYGATSSSSSVTANASMLNVTNQSYNGTKTLTSASGTTFSYNL